MVLYLEFGPFWVSRYDIGSIGAIFGVLVTKFRHVFKGEVKLKGDIDLESELRLGIGVVKSLIKFCTRIRGYTFETPLTGGK